MLNRINYIIIFLLLFSDAFAQETDILLKPLSIKFNNINVDSALRSIESKINHNFTYNPEVISNKKNIRANFLNYPLSVILDSLIADPLVCYRIIDKQIVIFLDKRIEEVKEEIIKPPVFKIIKGRTIDSLDNTPLAYATVSLLSKGTGTITNANGDFILKINEKYFLDTIIISHLGYKPLLIKVADALQWKSYALQVKSISLQEILIRWNDPKEIMTKALRKIKDNYPQKNVLLRTFYRESLQRNNKYMIYIEGLADVYKRAYRPTIYSDQARLLNLRRFTDFRANDTILVKLQGGIQASLSLDMVKSPIGFMLRQNLDQYNFFYEGMEGFDNTDVFKVRFEPNNYNKHKDYIGTVYIDTKTYAILKINFSLNKDNFSKYANDFVLRSSPKIKILPRLITYNAEYKKLGDKYYINYVSGDIQLRAKRKRKLISSSYKIHFEMITTDINTTGDIQKFRRKERIKSKQILTELKKSYFDKLANYWGNNNFILPEEDIQKALKKFKVEELTYQE